MDNDAVMSVIGRRLVILFAFFMPIIGVLAPKGMVVLLLLAGAAGVMAWVTEGKPRPPLEYRLLLLLAAFALWAAVTAAWTARPANALAVVAGLTILAIAGAAALFAIGRLDSDHQRMAENALLAGMLAGLAALTGESLWGTFKADPLTPLKTGTVALSLLAWPALAALWRRGRRLASGIGAIIVYINCAIVSSGAALLAPLIGLAGFAVFWIWGRRGAWFLAAGAALLVLTAPQIISSRPLQEGLAEAVATLPSSAGHRLKIWAFTVEKIDERPLWGWGMDGSRWIPKEDRRLGPETEILPLHPHNAFLQVRLELGLPGAIIVALLLGAFFARIVGGAGDRFAGAVMAGTTSAYLMVASVSYGIWQNWWMAFAWGLAALTAMVLRPSSSGKRSEPLLGGGASPWAGKQP